MPEGRSNARSRLFPLLKSPLYRAKTLSAAIPEGLSPQGNEWWRRPSCPQDCPGRMSESLQSVDLEKDKNGGQFCRFSQNQQFYGAQKKRLQFCERVGIGTPNGEGKNKNANVLLLVVTLLCLRLPLKRAKSSTSLNIPFSSILFFIWSSHSLILLPPVS